MFKLNRKELLQERGRCVEKLNMLRAKMYYAKHLMDAAKTAEAAKEIAGPRAHRSQLPAGWPREYRRPNGLSGFSRPLRCS